MSVAADGSLGRTILKIALVSIFLLRCDRAKPVKVNASKEPQIDATVVTIRTIVRPANRSYVHSLITDGKRARSGDEVDAWRLFDLAQNRVLFVDDVAKTYRAVPFQLLLNAHRAAAGQRAPEGIGSVKVAFSGQQKTILGFPSRELIETFGAYSRHLWISDRTSIPAQLHAFLQASQPLSGPMSGIMREADAALLQVRGFPLAEHSELPIGDKRLEVDREVLKIEKRKVPESWLSLPAAYKDATPQPPAEPGAPAASRPVGAPPPAPKKP